MAGRDFSDLPDASLMASLTSLLRGGSLVPDGLGGFKLQISSKFQWDTKTLHDKIGKANAKALQRAGMDVRQATRRGMSWRSPKAPREWKITTRGGISAATGTQRDSKGRFRKGSGKRYSAGPMTLVALIDKVPKSDVVTSWRTSRFPKGFLREDIEVDYSYSRQSVAIGPWRSPRVNQLLEFGGTTTHYFLPVRRRPRGRKSNYVYGRLTNKRPMVSGVRGMAQAGVYSFTRQVKGRRFMAKGLAKALPKIPERWRNSIKGP